MNNIDKLAKLFADRNNPKQIKITTGNVLSTDPLRIRYGKGIILERRHLIVASALTEGYTGEYTDDNGQTTVTRTITVKNKLHEGDTVILIPDDHFRMWYVVDKVGSL